MRLEVPVDVTFDSFQKRYRPGEKVVVRGEAYGTGVLPDEPGHLG